MFDRLQLSIGMQNARAEWTERARVIELLVEYADFVIPSLQSSLLRKLSKTVMAYLNVSTLQVS